MLFCLTESASENNDKLQLEPNRTIIANISVHVILFRINQHVHFEVHCDVLHSLGDERMQFIVNQTARLQVVTRPALASVQRGRLLPIFNE